MSFPNSHSSMWGTLSCFVCLGERCLFFEKESLVVQADTHPFHCRAEAGFELLNLASQACTPHPESSPWFHSAFPDGLESWILSHVPVIIFMSSFGLFVALLLSPNSWQILDINCVWDRWSQVAFCACCFPSGQKLSHLTENAVPDVYTSLLASAFGVVSGDLTKP